MRILRACYLEGETVPSLIHFSDFWVSYTFWALTRMLAVGDVDIAR
jgi:hypothetical protein